MHPLTATYTCILSLLLLSCRNPESGDTAVEASPQEMVIALDDRQLSNAGIAVGRFSDRTVSETLSLSGSIDVPPQNIVSISFPLGGYLRSTSLIPGMHVNRGQTIALMEDQSLVQLQQDYLTARARLEYARQEYERQKSLNETKTASDKVVQQAQADYETTRILMQGLAEKLRLIHIDPQRLSKGISRTVAIPSPITGFVSKVNVNIGKYVQPQDVLFELIDPADIHAALTVFEKDLNKIRQGQSVRVRLVDEPAKVYNAEVIIVQRNVDENRSGVIHCHFDKMPGNLKPGMYITATLTVADRNVKAVPEEAVVRYENKQYVFVRRSVGKFEGVEVKTGTVEDGWIEVVSADRKLYGEPVVVRNAFAVLSAMKNVAEE